MKHIEQCVRQLRAYRGFLPVFLEDELFLSAEKELQEIRAIQERTLNKKLNNKNSWRVYADKKRK